MNKKITTIDDLAVMIGQESRANEKRFNRLEERFDKLEGKFVVVEEKMATKQEMFRMEARIMSAIGEIKIELKDHDKRIITLEKIVSP